VKEGYREGDLIGKDGVEQTFEDVLRGTPRKLEVEVDSRGRVVRTIEERKAVAGKDVKLTLDADIQRMAEQSLAEGMDGARGIRDQNEKQRFENYRAGAGSVVALDPNDGSVVAMASNPTYDPSQFAAGITPEEFQQLNRPESNFPLVNRAVQGLYAPGSTFKPFTALAGLQTGQLDPNAGFYDQGCLTIGAEERCNAGKTPHGTVNLPAALTVSSDTYFYNVGRNMWQHYNAWTKAQSNGTGGAEDEISKGYAIQNTAKAYGFDRPTGVGLRDEAGGRVPDQPWKERFNQNEPDPRQKRERSLWLPGDNVNLAVGQGRPPRHAAPARQRVRRVRERRHALHAAARERGARAGHRPRPAAAGAPRVAAAAGPLDRAFARESPGDHGGADRRDDERIRNRVRRLPRHRRPHRRGQDGHRRGHRQAGHFAVRRHVAAGPTAVRRDGGDRGRWLRGVGRSAGRRPDLRRNQR